MYEVKAKDKLSFDVLIQLYHETANYDFWTEPRGLDESLQIMVAPAHQQTFVELMQAFKIEYSVKFPDVQRLQNKIVSFMFATFFNTVWTNLGWSMRAAKTSTPLQSSPKCTVATVAKLVTVSTGPATLTTQP